MVTELKSNIDIEVYLGQQKSLIDNHLKKIFIESNNYIEPKELWDAIRYSLLDGGKRIRSILCLASYEIVSPDKTHLDDCLTACASIELIHAMSLIHDDLPSMDNDDLRRGRPSCHKAHGEATAILAGDAMLSLAFEIIVENTKTISDSQKLKLISVLSKAFGLGLVPGQILDLKTSARQRSKSKIEEISKLKTAELIKASVLCGVIIALNNNKSITEKALNETIIKSFERFGINIGIAFQIIDDILDVTSDTKTLGKTSGKDRDQDKSTYPLIMGIEKSKKMTEDLIKKAKSDLAETPFNISLLCSISDFIINRIN